MRAIVKTKPGEGHLELREWPEPSAAPGEVKLRIAAVGICGTDLHIVKGTWSCNPPVVLGHEWCGTVVETGIGVKHLKPGDRVVASNPSRSCGVCYHCMAGNPFMCPERVSAGYMIDGAFADYLSIDARRCHRLPDHVTFREAALGEPLAVAVHGAIERTTVHPGDVVLISGPGCIGLLTLQVAKLQSGRVIVAGLEKDRQRLECARALGADVVVNVDEQDLEALVREQTGGWGADLVYECSGNPRSLAVCLDAIRKEGTLCQLGVYPGPIETDFRKIMMKELRVIGSYGYVWTSWQRTVRLLAEGKVNTHAMISHEFPLEDFERAFRIAEEGSAIKVVLTPNGTA